MAIGSELRGEKRVDPNPVLTMPACVDIARGHIQERDNGRGSSTSNLTVRLRKGRGYGCHRTCIKRLKGHVFNYKQDH
jgi:hypothetical protein